jgi:hypothetical protein
MAAAAAAGSSSGGGANANADEEDAAAASAPPSDEQHEQQQPPPTSPPVTTPAPPSSSYKSPFPLLAADPPLAAFIVGGLVVAAGLLNWVRAVSPLRRSSPYQFTVVFSEAHKVGEGTAVRMKGVEIGRVRRVAARPDAVAVDVEVFSSRMVVPLASRIDVNALGLMADAIIDITPPEGGLVGVGGGAAGGAAAALRGAGGGGARGVAGPRDARCASEALIVCEGARVAGHQGANMNFMMRMWLEHNDRTRTRAEW